MIRFIFWLDCSTDNVEGRLVDNKPRARERLWQYSGCWIELDRFGKALVIDLMCESEKGSRMTLESQREWITVGPLTPGQQVQRLSDVFFVHLYLSNCLNSL